MHFLYQREGDVHHLREGVLTLFGSSGLACQDVVADGQQSQGSLAGTGGISIYPYANYGRPGTKYEKMAEQRLYSFGTSTFR